MSGGDSPLGPWAPAPLGEVVRLFSGCGVPWWIAGGYAVELAVGSAFREHGDIDVALLRRDQHAAQRALASWEWWAADPPGHLRPWRAGEMLSAGVHDVWCRPGPDRPWRIQLMLEESEGELWSARHDARVIRPVPRIGLVTGDGVPYLAPEVQLLYKARDPLPKDEEDFGAVLPRLGPAQRRWLARAIALTGGHRPWVRRLDPFDRARDDGAL